MTCFVVTSTRMSSPLPSAAFLTRHGLMAPLAGLVNEQVFKRRFSCIHLPLGGFWLGRQQVAGGHLIVVGMAVFPDHEQPVGVMAMLANDRENVRHGRVFSGVRWMGGLRPD